MSIYLTCSGFDAIKIEAESSNPISIDDDYTSMEIEVKTPNISIEDKKPVIKLGDFSDSEKVIVRKTEIPENFQLVSGSFKIRGHSSFKTFINNSFNVFKNGGTNTDFEDFWLTSSGLLININSTFLFPLTNNKNRYLPIFINYRDNKWKWSFSNSNYILKSNSILNNQITDEFLREVYTVFLQDEIGALESSLTLSQQENNWFEINEENKAIAWNISLKSSSIKFKELIRNDKTQELKILPTVLRCEISENKVSYKFHENELLNEVPTIRSSITKTKDNDAISITDTQLKGEIDLSLLEQPADDGVTENNSSAEANRLNPLWLQTMSGWLSISPVSKDNEKRFPFASSGIAYESRAIEISHWFEKNFDEKSYRRKLFAQLLLDNTLNKELSIDLEKGDEIKCSIRFYDPAVTIATNPFSQNGGNLKYPNLPPSSVIDNQSPKTPAGQSGKKEVQNRNVNSPLILINTRLTKLYAQSFPSFRMSFDSEAENVFKLNLVNQNRKLKVVHWQRSKDFSLIPSVDWTANNNQQMSNSISAERTLLPLVVEDEVDIVPTFGPFEITGESKTSIENLSLDIPTENLNELFLYSVNPNLIGLVFQTNESGKVPQVRYANPLLDSLYSELPSELRKNILKEFQSFSYVDVKERFVENDDLTTETLRGLTEDDQVEFIQELREIKSDQDAREIKSDFEKIALDSFPEIKILSVEKNGEKIINYNILSEDGHGVSSIFGLNFELVSLIKNDAKWELTLGILNPFTGMSSQDDVSKTDTSSNLFGNPQSFIILTCKDKQKPTLKGKFIFKVNDKSIYSVEFSDFELDGDNLIAKETIIWVNTQSGLFSIKADGATTFSSVNKEIKLASESEQSIIQFSVENPESSGNLKISTEVIYNFPGLQLIEQYSSDLDPSQKLILDSKEQTSEIALESKEQETIKNIGNKIYITWAGKQPYSKEEKEVLLGDDFPINIKTLNRCFLILERTEDSVTIINGMIGWSAGDVFGMNAKGECHATMIFNNEEVKLELNGIWSNESKKLVSRKYKIEILFWDYELEVSYNENKLSILPDEKQKISRKRSVINHQIQSNNQTICEWNALSQVKCDGESLRVNCLMAVIKGVKNNLAKLPPTLLEHRPEINIAYKRIEEAISEINDYFFVNINIKLKNGEIFSIKTNQQIISPAELIPNWTEWGFETNSSDIGINDVATENSIIHIDSPPNTNNDETFYFGLTLVKEADNFNWLGCTVTEFNQKELNNSSTPLLWFIKDKRLERLFDFGESNSAIGESDLKEKAKAILVYSRWHKTAVLEVYNGGKVDWILIDSPLLNYSNSLDYLSGSASYPVQTSLNTDKSQRSALKPELNYEFVENMFELNKLEKQIAGYQNFKLNISENRWIDNQISNEKEEIESYRIEEQTIKSLNRQFIIERETPFEAAISDCRFNPFVGETDKFYSEFDFKRFPFFPKNIEFSFGVPRPGEKIRWGIKGLEFTENWEDKNISVFSKIECELRTYPQKTTDANAHFERYLKISSKKVDNYGEYNDDGEHNEISWQRFHTDSFALTDENQMFVAVNGPGSQIINLNNNEINLDLNIVSIQPLSQLESLIIVFSKDVPPDDIPKDFIEQNKTHRVTSDKVINQTYKSKISLSFNDDIADKEIFNISIFKEYLIEGHPTHPITNPGDGTTTLSYLNPEYIKLTNVNPFSTIIVTKSKEKLVESEPALMALISDESVIGYGVESNTQWQVIPQTEGIAEKEKTFVRWVKLGKFLDAWANLASNTGKKSYTLVSVSPTQSLWKKIQS